MWNEYGRFEGCYKYINRQLPQVRDGKGQLANRFEQFRTTPPLQVQVTPLQQPAQVRVSVIQTGGRHRWWYLLTIISPSPPPPPPHTQYGWYTCMNKSVFVVCFCSVVVVGRGWLSLNNTTCERKCMIKSSIDTMGYHSMHICVSSHRPCKSMNKYSPCAYVAFIHCHVVVLKAQIYLAIFHELLPCRLSNRASSCQAELGSSRRRGCPYGRTRPTSESLHGR